MNFVLVVAVLLVEGLAMEYKNEDARYWMKIGKIHLDKMIKQEGEIKHAKNVILFVGDGMGMSTVTSARIYKGQKTGLGESESLSFEEFRNTGFSKTYSADKQVTDSAASGTALFTGVKTRNEMLGLDAKIKGNLCDESAYKNSEIDSIMSWAQAGGKDTGFVTSTRVTHATPAALYAHISNRNWECDSAVPTQYRNCVKDIATQLVKNNPGKRFNVIMGGGANQLGLNGTTGSIFDGCNRTDNINLAKEWKHNRNNSEIVTTKTQLMNINVNDTGYLLGIFSPDHMYYAGEKKHKVHDQPSLVNMTTQAIKLLSKNNKGYVLMVEGGMIDLAHHSNFAKLALEETLEFEEAIAAAVKITNQEETLIIVTADHSHTLTINGYPDRGNDILGITEYSDQIFETLTYANGPGFSFHRTNSSSSLWRDLKNSSINRNNTYYQHFSPINVIYETHGGEDVPVYAYGPSSNLFSGVYQQNYIAHALSFGACIGPHASRCNTYSENSPHVDYVSCAGHNDTKCKQTTYSSSATTWRFSVLNVFFMIYLNFNFIQKI